MSDNFNTPTTSATKDEWLTPPPIINALGEFDLDPCAPIHRPWDMAKHHFTREDNGLLKPWHGRVWLNPPYGRETFKWMARLSEHKSGVGLIFARTDTQGFHREIFSKARALFFFSGRIAFHHVDGSVGDYPNAGSVLVAYSDFDRDSIANSGLKGALLDL